MHHCQGCKKLINDHSIETRLGRWHIQCFKCNKCKQRLSNETYIAFNGQLFHTHCFRCPSCRQVINARYVRYRGVPWHPICAQRQTAPLCCVCRNPLTDRYLVDFWGNQFCHTHDNHHECSSCGRLVCDHITEGGIQYRDGVVICNRCALHGITTQTQADGIAREMRSALDSIGLKLNTAQTPITLCSRDELNGARHHNFHENHPVLGVTRTTTTHHRGQVLARSFDRILIQINLPEEHFRTVMIHELTHAWFFYHYYEDLPLKVEEGMCVLMEYIWLKNQKTKEAKFRHQQIELSPDPIYGDGFRAAKQSLEYMPINTLIMFIKRKKKFPNRFSAFFF